MVIGEEVLEFKKVNVYKHVAIAGKKVLGLMRIKDMVHITPCNFSVENISGTRQARKFGGKSG